MASLEKDNLVVYYHLSEIVVAFDLSAFEIVVAFDLSAFEIVVAFDLSAFEIVVAFDLSAFEIVVALDEIGLIREGPPYSFFSKYSWI
jgi:hypothetical protein